jgi:lysozyme family protein
MPEIGQDVVSKLLGSVKKAKFPGSSWFNKDVSDGFNGLENTLIKTSDSNAGILTRQTQILLGAKDSLNTIQLLLKKRDTGDITQKRFLEELKRLQANNNAKSMVPSMVPALSVGKSGLPSIVAPLAKPSSGNIRGLLKKGGIAAVAIGAGTYLLKDSIEDIRKVRNESLTGQNEGESGLLNSRLGEYAKMSAEGALVGSFGGPIGAMVGAVAGGISAAVIDHEDMLKPIYDRSLEELLNSEVWNKGKIVFKHLPYFIGKATDIIEDKIGELHTETTAVSSEAGNSFLDYQKKGNDIIIDAISSGLGAVVGGIQDSVQWARKFNVERDPKKSQEMASKLFDSIGSSIESIQNKIIELIPSTIRDNLESLGTSEELMRGLLTGNKKLISDALLKKFTKKERDRIAKEAEGGSIAGELSEAERNAAIYAAKNEIDSGNIKNQGDMINSIMFGLEGGAKVTKDQGGTTKYGISQKAHPSLGEEGIKNLTEDQARKMYVEEYWNGADISSIKDPGLQYAALDASVNLGPNTAKAYLAQSGGDLAKFNELVRKRHVDLVASDPETYGSSAKGWATRDAKVSAASTELSSKFQAESAPAPDIKHPETKSSNDTSNNQNTQPPVIVQNNSSVGSNSVQNAANTPLNVDDLGLGAINMYGAW